MSIANRKNYTLFYFKSIAGTILLIHILNNKDYSMDAIQTLASLRNDEKEIKDTIVEAREEALAQLIEESPLYVGCKVRDAHTERELFITNLHLNQFDHLSCTAVSVEKDGTPSAHPTSVWCLLEELEVIDGR